MRLRQLVLSTPLATKFCRDHFTIGELRRVYEVLFHESLDSAALAERPEYVDKVRAYLAKVESLQRNQTPELQQTVWRLAQMLPDDDRSRPDLVTADETMEFKFQSKMSPRLRQAPSLSDALWMRRSATPSADPGEVAELWQRLARQSSAIRSPRSPRLLKRLDPTNFARKIQKLGILTAVEGSSRPTFDRYGKPAALFQLNSHHEHQPFLLRLDFADTDE